MGFGQLKRDLQVHADKCQVRLVSIDIKANNNINSNPGQLQQRIVHVNLHAFPFPNFEDAKSQEE